MLMGFREYARHRGVSLGAVQKAIKSNRISVNGDKKIDSEIADRDWDSNTDQSRVAMNIMDSSAPGSSSAVQKQIMLAPAAVNAQRQLDADDESDQEELKGGDKVANEYREHRATRERYQALKQQLEYEQLVGSLINVDDARRIAYTSFRGLRDLVLNVAPRIKDQLAATDDPLLCEQLLERELSAALSSIDVSKLLKEQEE